MTSRDRLAFTGKDACRPAVECYRRRQTPASVTSLARAGSNHCTHKPIAELNINPFHFTDCTIMTDWDLFNK